MSRFEAFLVWFLGRMVRRVPLAVKLRRVVAKDHVNERRGRPIQAAGFTAWRYLWSARASHAAA